MKECSVICELVLFIYIVFDVNHAKLNVIFNVHFYFWLLTFFSENVILTCFGTFFDSVILDSSNVNKYVTFEIF